MVIPVKVKPALFQLKGSGWHWAWLPELADIIGWTPERIVKTFRNLVKEEYDGYGHYRIGKLHWIDAKGTVCCLTGGDKPVHLDLVRRDPLDYQIFVPAGFSNDILDAHNRGIVRLELVYHSGRGPLKPVGNEPLRDFSVHHSTHSRMAIFGLTEGQSSAAASNWSYLHGFCNYSVVTDEEVVSQQRELALLRYKASS